jgi:hypothetical protein
MAELKKILSVSEKTENNLSVPLEILRFIVRLLDNLFPFLNEKTNTEFLTKVRAYTVARFSNISEKEIKDMNKESVSFLLKDIHYYLLKYFKKEEINKEIETIELNLALSFLKSPFLEKKLKGINEIKDICERLEISIVDKYPRDNYRSYDNNNYSQLKYLTPDIFVNWFIENRILEFILGDSIHLEIIKRCHEIFKFICKRKEVSEELVVSIWNASLGKFRSLPPDLVSYLV